MHYDLIGDIHGHADELAALLKKLGYRKSCENKDTHVEQNTDNPNVYRSTHQPPRQVIFVGDLIDRGPQIREVLEIVRPMVEAGQALCISGNHEYNAVKFASGQREHTIKNILQHHKTLQAFQNRDQEWQGYIEWFKTLPLYLDLPELRVVHAVWRPELLITDTPLPDDIDQEVVEAVLKGEKLKLPDGLTYLDKDGNTRNQCRINWWNNPKEPDLTLHQYVESMAIHKGGLPDIPVSELEMSEDWLNGQFGYPVDAKPVFFGHYWLRGKPKLQRTNVCCLDYSVAKGDKLLAYRFDGEQHLDAKKFVWVKSSLSYPKWIQKAILGRRSGTKIK